MSDVPPRSEWKTFRTLRSAYKKKKHFPNTVHFLAWREFSKTTLFRHRQRILYQPGGEIRVRGEAYDCPERFLRASRCTENNVFQYTVGQGGYSTLHVLVGTSSFHSGRGNCREKSTSAPFPMGSRWYTMVSSSKQHKTVKNYSGVVLEFFCCLAFLSLQRETVVERHTVRKSSF